MGLAHGSLLCLEPAKTVVAVVDGCPKPLEAGLAGLPLARAPVVHGVVRWLHHLKGDIHIRVAILQSVVVFQVQGYVCDYYI